MRLPREASVRANMKIKQCIERNVAIGRMLTYDSDEDVDTPQITQSMTISCTGCKQKVKNGDRFCIRTGGFFHMGQNYCKQHFDKITNASSSSDSSSSIQRSKEYNFILYQPDTTQCSICFNKINESDLTVTNCGHMFHHVCLLKWKLHNSSCPYCRKITNPFRGSSSSLKLVKEIKPRSYC